MSTSARRTESTRQFSAIDGDGCTRNERRLVGRDKQDGLSDLFGCADALHRDACDQGGFFLGSAGKAVKHPGLDRAWGDYVDAYAGLRDFQRGQTFHGVLAGNIDRRARATGPFSGCRNHACPA